MGQPREHTLPISLAIIWLAPSSSRGATSSAACASGTRSRSSTSASRTVRSGCAPAAPSVLHTVPPLPAAPPLPSVGRPIGAVAPAAGFAAGSGAVGGASSSDAPPGDPPRGARLDAEARCSCAYSCSKRMPLQALSPLKPNPARCLHFLRHVSAAQEGALHAC